MMPKPLEIDVSGTYSKRVGTYKGHASYGPDLATNVEGKYNMIGGATPVSGDMDVELITPVEKYNNLKAHVGGSMLMPQHDGHFEVRKHNLEIVYIANDNDHASGVPRSSHD